MRWLGWLSDAWYMQVQMLDTCRQLWTHAEMSMYSTVNRSCRGLYALEGQEPSHILEPGPAFLIPDSIASLLPCDIVVL